MGRCSDTHLEAVRPAQGRQGKETVETRPAGSGSAGACANLKSLAKTIAQVEVGTAEIQRPLFWDARACHAPIHFGFWWNRALLIEWCPCVVCKLERRETRVEDSGRERRLRNCEVRSFLSNSIGCATLRQVAFGDDSQLLHTVMAACIRVLPCLERHHRFCVLFVESLLLLFHREGRDVVPEVLTTDL